MSLSHDFDQLPGDSLTSGAINIELHPTRPLILLQVEGTTITLGLDDAGLMRLVTRLIDCHEQLIDRIPNQ